MTNFKNILLGSSLLLLNGMTAMAQTDGGISPEMLAKIQQTRPQGNAEKALANAMATMSINDLAKNAAKQGKIDTKFSIETPKQNIHNQKSSGRCWMFSSMNVLRSRFALEHKDTLAVEYSQDYLFFYDQLEKANLFLQGTIETASKPIDDSEVKFFFRSPLNDGGTFCGIIDLTKKYGLELRSMVAAKKKAAAINTRKTEMLAEVYRILSMTLGEPVREFRYAHRDKNGNIKGEEKTYTPMEFYKETVKEQIEDTFIMLMNDPRHPYYKVYEVEYDRHTYDGHNWRYINLPIEDIESIAIASLKDGRKMYSSYDLPQMDRNRGYMDLNLWDYSTLFNTQFPMNKAERISTFESMSAHAMTLTAVDLDKNGKPKKWKVENSWGAGNGQQGYAIMTEEWFREYMFRLVVDKKYVPENILKLKDEKPTMIPYDDPLFKAEE